ncbi:MAG: SusC/RagA family TonB-linked outer membrane protein [Gloeobacteraceae cyanobacterium ES-bin-316]|nr:SusC/RagA family TonB-linked outer membrane protein [Ferruginibacter sp.]
MYAVEVSGTVTDATTGNILSGATVLVKGSRLSTVTDAAGNYSISIPGNNDVLIFSYVGYASREVAANGQTVINVALNPAGTELSQVVVMGYGSQNKRDITSAVKSVKSEDFNRGIINAPEQLLQGKVAGVNVTTASGEPGGAINITVRGPGSLRAQSTPLFVIDGVALDNSSTGGGNPLNFLNPQDIESMDVLKDASATAIYGSRGSNGVILITTKKGKAGASVLTFSSSLGISTMARPLKVFSAAEFRKQVVAVGGVLDDKGGNTDWQKEISQTALTQNYNVALSGGANKLTYYTSFGLQNQEGILKNNDFKRYTGRFNATQKFLEDRLIIEANLTASGTLNNRPANALGDAISNNPTYPAYDSAGKPALYPTFSNPLEYLSTYKDIAKINRTLGNLSSSFRIIKGLVYKFNFGLDVSSGQRDYQQMPTLLPVREGRLETYYTTNNNTLVENYLTYNFTKGSHVFSLLGGHSYQKIVLQGRNYSVNRFAITGIEPIYNPGLGQDLTLANNRPGGYAIENELQSGFGKINYQYKNKYLATANFRADGSTKFGGNNKYGYFPSFSVGWKITGEDFMANSIFSNLKLRAGWGQTGNQEIPSKITKASYTSSVSGTTSYPLSGTGPFPAGITFVRLDNPDLQWEVSKQTNIAVDFGLLKGRLNGSVDVFRKVSSNILLTSIPADPIQPVPTYFDNVDDMEITNQGVEIDLQYQQTTAKGLTFGVGGNATFIDNEVSKSPYKVITSGSASGSGLTSATLNGYINGEPLGTFYLLDFIGFNANGTSKFRDTDGDAIITDKDRIAAGSALPNFLYNFFGSASYKGFDFIANFNGVSGNKIYDNTANSFFYKARLVKGINTTAEGIGSPEESINNAAGISTRYLKDGAFLRLNNAALGYTFNTAKMGIKWATALRLSVTGQNLFVITDYDGYDPEVNTDRTSGDGVLSSGIDYLSYPKARSVIIGLNLSF